MASAAKSTDSRALGYYSVCGWRSSALPSGLQLQQRAPISGISASASSTTVRTWSVSSLLAHSSLTLEVQCTMCEELLRQLCCATHARQVRGPGGADTVCGSSGPSLVQLVTKLGTELELNSSTSSTVLTVLASHLCKCVSGAVDLLGGSGRHVLLRWLRARLQHEPIPPAATSVTSAAQASTASPAGAPQVILLRWREAAQSMVLSTSDSRVGVDLHASFALGNSEPAATDGASISRPEYHRPLPGMPVLSLLPPTLHDLLADGQLVGMGYGSREVLLVLFYMHIHHTNGVQERAVADLLEDVSSSLGTKAAAALDRGAFRYAIRLLCRWRLLRVVEAHSQLLEICGSDTRLREFLLAVLSKQAEWCEAELGLDAREIMRFRSLL
ncbi:hypothetical protein, conserved [Leishmania tarentolae]|uniref:Uncharacterized protein n=1 Tax=Leishmania tarentolae TaxID=5689 RepID=A0A640KDW6_LEITA|nr:hypothetical protein, conserved [Leishmania tarentolae]